jgi:hypothetical protein
MFSRVEDLFVDASELDDFWGEPKKVLEIIFFFDCNFFNQLEIPFLCLAQTQTWMVQ